MVVRIHPREPTFPMQANYIIIATLAANLAAGCKRNDGSPSTATAVSSAEMIGCNHDAKSNAVAKHSWPYPAESRNLRWGSNYKQMKLKLRPSPAAFITATVTWKEGELIAVEDSQVVVTKPRRLVAKRDLYVKRKVWDQGIQVQRTDRAVAAGDLGNFLFYNSRGMCMIATEQGLGWTPCTLDDAFEGLSAEHPFACEQTWWVKVRKSKIDRGWMPVALDLMDRVPPMSDAAK
jgi:hypothetical protein